MISTIFIDKKSNNKDLFPGEEPGSMTRHVTWSFYVVTVEESSVVVSACLHCHSQDNNDVTITHDDCCQQHLLLIDLEIMNPVLWMVALSQLFLNLEKLSPLNLLSIHMKLSGVDFEKWGILRNQTLREMFEAVEVYLKAACILKQKKKVFLIFYSILFENNKVKLFSQFPSSRTLTFF